MKEATIDYALRATWQAVARMYNEEAKNFDSTMAVGFTLLSIDPKSLKSMEEKGLIKRKPNPNDGRGVLIYLTEFGLEKRNDSKSTVLRFNEAVKQEVSEEKLSSFFEVIDIINKLISDKKLFSKDISNH